MTESAAINGEVAPGYESVRTAFAKSFAELGELGAACTVFHKGRKVVDLWGGVADQGTGDTWREDTLVLVYSLTKGMTALAAAVAVSRGLFAYETRVAEIWPEFAASGKQAVTVRQLLSEQAGLAAIDLDLTLQTMGDQDRIAAAIAAQTPNWMPGDQSGNHAYSLGWFTSELIRRADPQHRSLGRFFAEELAGPLRADFHIGLPAGFPTARLARIAGFKPWEMILHMGTMPPMMVLSLLWPWSLSSRALNNPKLAGGPADLDQPVHWSVEDGGAGGVGSARALATIYNEFATGGHTLGVKPQVLEALMASPVPPRNGFRDQVLKTDLCYSLGFEKMGGDFDFDASPQAFGTFALGGSFAFADPAKSIAYAYVTNKLGFYKWGDPRERSVRQAFMGCEGIGGT
jgi:CubicO group peptidase (beta-lactamase class C family)